MLGVSHSGIRLIKRERDVNKDNLVAVETYRLAIVESMKQKKTKSLYCYY